MCSHKHKFVQEQCNSIYLDTHVTSIEPFISITRSNLLVLTGMCQDGCLTLATILLINGMCLSAHLHQNMPLPVYSAVPFPLAREMETADH